MTIIIKTGTVEGQPFVLLRRPDTQEYEFIDHTGTTPLVPHVPEKTVPDFVRGHQFVKINKATTYTTAKLDGTDKNLAEGVSSFSHSQYDGTRMHRPVLDIDFPAELIPSSTEGHFHLYLNKLLPEDRYFDLLDALADAGIIEEGYSEVSQVQGASCVRLPHVKKAGKETL